jgi:hypothetical protein
MSLRKSPTLTPALLAANRHNAKKSTGPRTARGKAWSRLNRLRHGARSPEYINFLNALLDAQPGRVAVRAQALLQSQAVLHPLFSEIAELSIQAEIDICEESRRNRALRKCENNLFMRSKPESH